MVNAVATTKVKVVLETSRDASALKHAFDALGIATEPCGPICPANVKTLVIGLRRAINLLDLSAII